LAYRQIVRDQIEAQLAEFFAQEAKLKADGTKVRSKEVEAIAN
jgi:hypothetical protein